MPLDAYELDESQRLAQQIADSEDARASASKRLERAIVNAASASPAERVARE
jgi:hypothetical protein